MPTTQIRADVAAAQDGDNRAFARLVDQTYSDVFLLAARLTRDHDDALGRDAKRRLEGLNVDCELVQTRPGLETGFVSCDLCLLYTTDAADE